MAIVTYYIVDNSTNICSSIISWDDTYTYTPETGYYVVTTSGGIIGKSQWTGSAWSNPSTGSGFAPESGVIKSYEIVPAVSTLTTDTSVTPDTTAYNQYSYTALASAFTINAPSNTPVAGTKLLFRFKDNGTSRTLTWNSIYRAIAVTLPTSTTASKVTYVGCVYNATESLWDVIAVATQA